MKKIFSIILIGCIFITATSCDDFLTETPTTAIPEEDAFVAANDYVNALNGVYYTIGNYYFLGRNVLALGDVASDLSNHSAATTHFFNIFTYQIAETNLYVEQIWAYGYYAMDRSARIIQAGLAESNMNELDMVTVHKCMAQAYGIKALSAFILANIYGLPYSEANKSSLGIVNIGDAPLPAEENVSRVSVEENYRQILSDITKAKEYYTKPGVTDAEYINMNLAAVYALESRVKLYMQDYEGAISAATAAIEQRKGTVISTEGDYQNMFRDLTISSEDIFVLAKSETDYLSANSLSTLWTTYGVSLNESTINEFGEDDIRLSLLTGSWSGGKNGGIWTNDQIQNLPVFRLPEMYLTLAEAYAATGDYTKAKANLLEVAAKRNPSLNTEGIPENESIRSIILKERKLELAQEGHRFFDVRRIGETIDVSNGSAKNFQIYNFQYPIPAAEINSGFGVTQTPGWSTNLPK